MCAYNMYRVIFFLLQFWFLVYVYLQGRIVAEDGGSPPRSATATAVINILRNLNAPVFNPKSYTATIIETHQVGYDIVTVTATDADQIVSVWLIKLNMNQLSSLTWLPLMTNMKAWLFSKGIIYRKNIVLFWECYLFQLPNNEILFEMSDTTPNLNNAGLNYFSIRTENNRGLISITLPLYIDNLNTAVYTVCFFWFLYFMICLCPLHKSVIYILFSILCNHIIHTFAGYDWLSINCCCKQMSSFSSLSGLVTMEALHGSLWTRQQWPSLCTETCSPQYSKVNLTLRLWTSTVQVGLQCDKSTPQMLMLRYICLYSDFSPLGFVNLVVLLWIFSALISWIFDFIFENWKSYMNLFLLVVNCFLMTCSRFSKEICKSYNLFHLSLHHDTIPEST